MPTDTRRLVLLDAHAIIHRAYHALPDFSTAKGEPTGALYGLSSMLIKIIEELKPDYVVACYDLKGPTYRHEVYKEYKAQRKKADSDLITQIEKSPKVFEAFDVPIYSHPGFEADDLLGTIVEQTKDDPSIEIIIASGDMDTLQLVDGVKVRVFTLKKGLSDTVMYDEKGVNKRFGFEPLQIPDYKGLRGDPSDNIPGVKGIGEKTATTLIQEFGTVENIYKELEAGKDEKFAKVGITPRIIQVLKDNKEEADFSKMLATIRRDAPVKFVLPTKKFKEAIDVKKVSAFWQSLEFRTLTQRLERVLAGGSTMMAKEIPPPKPPLADVDPSEVEKVALALWLVESNITNPKIEDIRAFAKTDDFAQAKEVIMKEMDKREVRKVYEGIELPLIPILHSMEKKGVKIDRALLAKLSKTYTTELNSLEKRIWQETGLEFNINSPKQLGDVLFDKLGLKAKNQKKTAGGARSTKESELEKMRDMHPVVPLIFEYRELAKLLSTYIDAMPPQLDANDRLHTHFIQTGSTTGRMASQNPNLQNIPIKSELGRAIRGAFIAEKGFKLVAIDYSQMELRIAAFLSVDEKLVDIFKKGQDVHSSVASFVFMVDPDNVTSEMRRQAKVINFGIIYGMGVLALKQNLGSTREAAQKFLNDYFQTFSTLAKYLDQIKIDTAKKGYTETLFGRRRYFEGINSKIPYVRAQAERMAINAPIQGTGADIIKLAMVRVYDYIKKEKLEETVFPVLQVHDELLFEIRDDKVEEVLPEIKKIMESVVDPKDTLGVPILVESAVGNNWGELK